MNDRAGVKLDAIRLVSDPHSPSGERWIGQFPAGVIWHRLEDRLLARGWYPKNAVSRLLVYGCDGGHEIVIEPATRRIVLRVAPVQALGVDRSAVAESLGRVLAEEATALGGHLGSEPRAA